MAQISKVNILDVQFSKVENTQLLKECSKRIKEGKKTKIAFANSEYMVEAKKGFLQNYLENCDFVLPDGWWVLWASRRLHAHPQNQLVKRVTGTDFVHPLAKTCEEHNFRLFLLGSDQKTLLLAVEKLQIMYPKLKVSSQDGYFNSNTEVIKKINDFKTDVLMVCLGSPFQELWIQNNEKKLTSPLIFGNGGAIDFLAGKVKRAPNWMQKIGMEWLFRLLNDFNWIRFKRQFRIVFFITMVLIESLTKPRGKKVKT
jgi:N-acetylglucosaminyldiphosphoundecaprenol N-acetyl-beta-D-mannosaminyltransferase